MVLKIGTSDIFFLCTGCVRVANTVSVPVLSENKMLRYSRIVKCYSVLASMCKLDSWNSLCKLCTQKLRYLLLSQHFYTSFPRSFNELWNFFFLWIVMFYVLICFLKHISNLKKTPTIPKFSFHPMMFN